MIFSKDIKNLKIYTRKMFLPTLEDSDTPNKKTKSAIFLLTPNRNSSIQLMNHPLMVNMKRYQSYYIEKDLTYFINSKLIKADDRMDEDYVFAQSIDEVLTECGDSAVPNTFLTYSGFKTDCDILKNVIIDSDIKDILIRLCSNQNTVKPL